MRLRSGLVLGALALALALVFAGCQQPTSSTVTTLPSRGANQVTATLSGVVLDGFGKPLSGVTIKYDDGNNPNISRSITTATTDSNGYYELQMLNEVYSLAVGAGDTATVQIVLDAGSSYVQKRVAITVPSIATIRGAYGTALVADQKVYISSTNSTQGATPSQTTTYAVATVVPGASTTVAGAAPAYSGFHVYKDLGTNYLFKLDGEAVGIFKITTDSLLPEAAATLPPVGSLVSFTIDSTYSPSVFWAKTDATGQFVFSATAAATLPEGKANALPTFMKSITSAFAVSSNAAPTAYTLSIQPTGKTQTTYGSSSAGDNFGLNGAFFNTLNMPVMGITPLMGTEAFKNDFGTLYAIADKSPRIIGWTPVTTYSSTDSAAMDPLTSTSTPAPLTFTFSKAMDQAKCLASNIAITSTGMNYAVIAPTIAWDTSGTVLTVTPAVAFKKGATVTVTFTNFTASDGNDLPTSSSANSKTFVVKGGIAFVSGNWQDAWGNASGLITDSSTVIDVTFNLAPAATSGFDPAKTFLTDNAGSKDVPATITVDATNKKLVFTVAAGTLVAGSTYKVNFYVTSGISGDAAVWTGDTTLFTSVPTFTVGTTALTAPTTLAVDTLAQSMLLGRTTYNAGEALKVTMDPVVGVTTGAKYTFWYSTDAKTWTDTGATVTYTLGNSKVLASIPAALWASGQTLQIKAKATNAASIAAETSKDTVYSNIVSVTDQVAPTLARIGGTSVTSSGSSATDTVSVTPTQSGGAALTTTVNGIYYFTMDLGASGGKIGTPVLGTLPTGMTSLGFDQATSSSQVTFAFSLAASTTNTYNAKTFTVQLADFAGNNYVGTFLPAATKTITVTLAGLPY